MGGQCGKFSKIAGGMQIGNFGSLIIGDYCWVSINSKFIMREGTYITIGNNTCIGPELMVISDSHMIGHEYKRSGEATFGNIEIGTGCWLGARVTILPNVKIGSGVVIAAGSVVIDNIPDNTLVAGVPAKIKKYLN